MLQFFGHNNPNLTIEHIFYLSSDDESYNLQKQNYNIICLQKITPFINAPAPIILITIIITLTLILIT